MEQLSPEPTPLEKAIENRRKQAAEQYQRIKKVAEEMGFVEVEDDGWGYRSDALPGAPLGFSDLSKSTLIDPSLKEPESGDHSASN